MIKILFILCGFIASQHIADAVRTGIGMDTFKGWFIGVAVQYLICLALFLAIDKAGFSESMNASFSAVAFTRFFYWFAKLSNSRRMF